MRLIKTRYPLLLTAALALGACGADETRDPPTTTTPGDPMDWTQKASLTAARDCEGAGLAFKAGVVSQMELELDRTERCYLGDGGCYRWLEGDVAAGGDGAPTAPNDDATPDEYSETNTQVEGVDEADRVKTDGTSIVALFGNSLVKLSSWPAAATHESGRASVKGYPQHFFLADGKAVVLSSANTYDLLSPEDRARYERGELEQDMRWWSGLTLITTFDVTGAAPVRLSERVIDGYTIANRRIGDKVYLAQSTWVYVDGLQYWPENLAEGADAATITAEFDRLRAKNHALIDALPLDYWLPREVSLNAAGTIDEGTSRTYVDCDQVYQPNVYSGQGLLTVATYDVDDDTLTGSTIQGSWGNVYASTDAFYIATTNWDFYWWWESQTEAPPLTTHIHKFAFDDDGVAQYTASGSVLGYAINQFSFDEHDDVLRVATTDGFGWWNNGETTTESRVTTLAQTGDQLVEQGVVAGLGKGEQIYSARFIGDKGYVVTFRQVDPLYVLDLADPKAPKVAGELKIPGFSSYIHPLDDGHLLTIGRDATDEGQVGGLKLEVFDVSDPSAPKSTVTKVLGDGWNTWSEAQYDHHAFVYYPERDLLAIPVSGYSWDEQTGYGEYQSELFVFHVDADTVEELPGRPSHTALVEELGPDRSCYDWYGWSEAWISRGLFIEDYVYSISNVGVQVHDTRDFSQGPVASVLVADTTTWWNQWGGSYGCDVVDARE